jgi:hypothetical protein
MYEKKIIIVACVAAVAGIIAIVIIALGLGGPKAIVSLPSSGQGADSLNTTHSSSINTIKNDASAPYINASDNGTAEAKPPTIEDQQYPIPAGFTRASNFSLGSDWKFWGKYTTNYASGGEGPSERWDNAKMNKLDMVAGFDFKIGPDFDYKTGTIQGNPLDGVVALKFPRCVSVGGERGDYIPHIDWKVDDGNSIGMAGKEWPHPVTSQLKFNTDNPMPQIGDIKDGKWHSFLAAVYNDPKNNDAVTIQLWYNPTASGNLQDYIYLGKSIDTPTNRMEPGPILPYDCQITTGGTHPMQIRIDAIPENELFVRNMYAAEVIPPH